MNVNQGFEFAGNWEYGTGTNRSTLYPYEGNYAAFVGSTINQTAGVRQLSVQIPAWAETARLYYYLRMNTSEPIGSSVFDQLYVFASDQAGVTFYATARFDNTKTRNAYEGWYTNVMSTTQIRGQKLYIGAIADNDGSNTTTWWIDNVFLMVGCGAAIANTGAMEAPSGLGMPIGVLPQAFGN